jgi:toxin ParE1/3/4
VNRRYRVEYLPVAEQDLLEIVDYIARDRPQAARAFVDRLDRAVTRLETFPRSAKRPKDERLRRLGDRVLVVEEFLVFYAITDRTVQIRRVIHGARRYDFLLPRD